MQIIEEKKMLIISCMRSASSSLYKFMLDEFGFMPPPQGDVGDLEAPLRDWRNGEGVEGYVYIPGSSQRLIDPEILKNVALRKDQIIRDHVLPIQQHRDALMSIKKELRKVVILKRDAIETFNSQMARRFKKNCNLFVKISKRDRSLCQGQTPIIFWEVNGAPYTGPTLTTEFPGDTVPGERTFPGEVWHANIMISVGADTIASRVKFKTFQNDPYVCHYRSFTENKEKCRQAFALYRKNIDIMFPEEDGFLHIEFKDLITNQDKEIKKILNYLSIPYDIDKKYKLPHVR
jgi:RNA binding exosome subunit